MAKRATARELTVRPLTPAHVDDVKKVTAGTWGATCWDLYPRYSAEEQRELGLDKGGEPARRAQLARLARRRKAPGLVAYTGREPIGWIAIGPRLDFTKIERSRATPRVDDVDVWVIPCITVRRGHRGEGVAVAMIRAAVDYAAKLGAPAVEAYPRASNARLHDDFVFFGNEAMFRKAGFRQVRGVHPDLPKTWTPRVTMRRTTTRRGAPAGRRTAADSAPRARARRPRGASAPPRRSRGARRSAGARGTGA